MAVEGESDTDGDEGRREDARRRCRRLTLAPRLTSLGRDLPCGDHGDAEVEAASICIEEDGKEEGDAPQPRPMMHLFLIWSLRRTETTLRQSSLCKLVPDLKDVIVHAVDASFGLGKVLYLGEHRRRH
jgi:hypothetical protein